MKKSFLSIVFTLLLSGICFSQWGNTIKLSSNITSETKNITGFTAIDVSDDFVVYINFSDTEEKVEIEANENLHELIIVKNDNGTLKIRTQSYSTNSRLGADERLIAHITAKNLKAISASGDAEIKLKDKLKASSFDLFLDDDAVLSGHVDIQNLKVEMDDDAELEIEGAVDQMKVDADSDSMLDGYKLTVNDLDIRLRGDSEARMTVNRDIKISAKGDSEFTYRGNAKISKKSVGGDSDIRHIGK